jgi:cysteine desulfurase/selenocysteine lyase
MCGPTGIGCLYGKKELLDKLSSFIVGGETVTDADLNSHVFEKIPQKLEGGIQNYAGVIGLGATVDYLKKIGMDNIEKHEKELAKNLLEGISNINGLSIIGPKDWKKKDALVAFTVKGLGPHDVAMLLDHENICIRSGMHCDYSFHKFINESKGSARASLYFYNTKEEIAIFIDKLNNIVKTFR